MVLHKRPLIYIPNKKVKKTTAPTPPTPTTRYDNVVYRKAKRFKDSHIVEVDTKLGCAVDDTIVLENNPTLDFASGGILRLFLIYGWGNDLVTYLNNTRWESENYDNYLSLSIQSNMMVIAQNDPNVYRVNNRQVGGYQFNIFRDSYTFTMPDSSTQNVYLNKVSGQFYLPDVITQLNSQYGITPYCLVFPNATGGHFPLSTADILTIFNDILVSVDATFASKTGVIDYQFT